MPDFLCHKLTSAVKRLQDVPRALRLAWQAAPGWTAASAALLIAPGPSSHSPPSGFRARSSMPPSPPSGSGAGWRHARGGAIVSALLIAAVALAGELGEASPAWVRTNQGERVQDHILDLVHRKSVEVELSFYDSPEFFDRLHRARAEGYYRPLALIESAGNLAQNARHARHHVRPPVRLPDRGCLWLWPQALLPPSGSYSAMPSASTKCVLPPRTKERRAQYYDWLLTSRESAAELRLFGLGTHFRTAFNQLRDGLRGKRIALARDNAAAELLAGTSALAVTGASLAWMFSRALSGLLSLGNLTLFYQALQQGLRVIRSVLDNVGQLYYNSLFVSNLLSSSPSGPR